MVPINLNYFLSLHLRIHPTLTWSISVILHVLHIRAYSFVFLSEEDKASCLKTETCEEYLDRREEVTGWGTLRDEELNSLRSSDISALMQALVVHIVHTNGR
jgi:hypothetical protein